MCWVLDLIYLFEYKYTKMFLRDFQTFFKIFNQLQLDAILLLTTRDQYSLALDSCTR